MFMKISIRFTMGESGLAHARFIVKSHLEQHPENGYVLPHTSAVVIQALL
jgi:hypothetical protein